MSSIYMSLPDLERKEQESEQLKMDCEHFKARLETVQADSIREKEVRCPLPVPRAPIVAACTPWHWLAPL